MSRLQWRKVDRKTQRAIFAALDRLGKAHGAATAVVGMVRYANLFKERLKRQRIIAETERELADLKAKS